MDIQFFDERQLVDLKNGDMWEEENSEDVELEGIDMVTWKKKNRLWVVLQEYNLELLCQYHNSQMVGD